MTVVTKKGKYAKYRYEAFSKLAELTDKLLLKAGAWSEITADRVAYNRLVFECKVEGPHLSTTRVLFNGVEVGRYILSPFVAPSLRIYSDSSNRQYGSLALDGKEVEFISKQLREMTKVTDKEEGYIFNQYLKATQWGIHYWYTLKNSAQFEFIWGTPER